MLKMIAVEFKNKLAGLFLSLKSEKNIKEESMDSKPSLLDQVSHFYDDTAIEELYTDETPWLHV